MTGTNVMATSTPTRPLNVGSTTVLDRDAIGRPIDLRLDANECRSNDPGPVATAGGTSTVDLAAYPDRRKRSGQAEQREDHRPERRELRSSAHGWAAVAGLCIVEAATWSPCVVVWLCGPHGFVEKPKVRKSRRGNFS